MNNIFNGCSSLSLLPNISYWNSNNVIYRSDMFKDSLNISLNFK